VEEERRCVEWTETGEDQGKIDLKLDELLEKTERR
jgi:hypothetical protein